MGDFEIKERKMLTAKDALQITEKADRLLNSVLRNIKGCAELGQSCYDMSNELNEKAVQTLTQKLEELGYNVEKYYMSDEEPVSDTETIIHNIVHLRISW